MLRVLLYGRGLWFLPSCELLDRALLRLSLLPWRLTYVCCPIRPFDGIPGSAVEDTLVVTHDVSIIGISHAVQCDLCLLLSIE